WGGLEFGGRLVKSVLRHVLAGAVDKLDPTGVVLLGGELNSQVTGRVDQPGNAEEQHGAGEQTDADAHVTVHGLPANAIDVVVLVFVAKINLVVDKKGKAHGRQVDENKRHDRWNHGQPGG